MFPAHTSSFHVTSLIDSGCSGKAFADRAFVESNGILTRTLPHRRELHLADGKVADIITDYFIMDIAMGLHRETWLFFVTTLSPETPVIFGLPWLRCHNPSIDWSKMTLSFTSGYCATQCCPQDSSRIVRAPVVNSFCSTPRLAGITESSLPQKKPAVALRQPYVEDDIEDEGYISSSTGYTEGDYDITIDPTLTTGANHYYTRACAGGEGTRAQMIGNRSSTRPVPIGKTAGSRRRRPNPRRDPLPPLSAPIPVTYAPIESPNMDDIRWLQAASFVSFCQQDGVRAIRLTWDDLDRAVNHKPSSLPPPTDLQDLEYKSILQGNRDLRETLSQLPPHLHNFVLDCYRPAHLH
ncbi:hypothetical protein H4I95_03633 [Botrytis cinerea]